MLQIKDTLHYRAHFTIDSSSRQAMEAETNFVVSKLKEDPTIVRDYLGAIYGS